MKPLQVVFLLVILLGSFIVPVPDHVQAATLPTGFQESIVFSGLTNPTNIRFAPDGRVFVAEKSGRIKVFDNLQDGSPDIFADLRTNTYNFWDRGMLGLALHPNFSTTPYVYVLYTFDYDGSPPIPSWGTPDTTSDPCPSPPGATANGCLVYGRLSRLRASGNVMSGAEEVLIEDWCQQFPSHSVGDLIFRADQGNDSWYLYASAGDGASFNYVDYGQTGNPCGDPPAAVGDTMTPPTAAGGALRSQSLRRPGGPVTLDGTVARVNPTTGEYRIIAYGLRNPFRMALRPNFNEIWVGDVGWSTWEELNRIPNPADSVVENFGWPCYEGHGRQPGYDGANLAICETLYSEGPSAMTAPYHTYSHGAKVVSNDNCPTGSSSIAGLAFEFYSGGPYPSEYDGALFFSDYSRDCIWVMFNGPNGHPNPGNIRPFVEGAANPVDLEIGPNGDLYYVDFDGGTIRRIQYFSQNNPPNAIATANPTTGSAPLTVTFNGAGSSDPDVGDTITFAWDLDGDGAYDDSTAVQPSFVYTNSGTYVVRLQVTDNHGASNISDPITITVGNTPPTATINSPAPGTTWKVGDVINFSGSATDAQDGTLPPSALTWSLIMHHGQPPSDHTHLIQTFPGIATGSFTAPDHEYPSYLELRLTAADSGGLTSTTSLQLNPRTVTLTFQSNPGGLQIAVNGATRSASFTVTVIVGSSNTISAVSPQNKGKTPYYYESWSDGGAQTHTITAPALPSTYTVRFRRR